MMVQQNTRSRAQNKFKHKVFRGTLKCPTYQSEMAPTVLIEYFVGSDKKRQAEPPVDPIDAFFKSIAATIKTFSPYHQNICKSSILAIVSAVEMTEVLQESKSTHSSEYSTGAPNEPRVQETRL